MVLTGLARPPLGLSANRKGTGIVTHLQGSKREYDPGDHITATCDICGVRCREPLEGRVDHDREQAALDRLTTWMEAHMEQFHPDEVLGIVQGP